MIKVNLVPADILAKARQRQLVLQAALAGGALFVFLVLASFAHWLHLHNLEMEYQQKESQLNQLKAIVAQVEELEKAGQAVRARLGVIEDLLKGRAFYPVFMSELAKGVPGGVQLSQLSTTLQSQSSLKMTIAGTANSNEDIASFVRTLEKNPHYDKVELGAVTAAGAKKYSFTITTMYNNKL